MTKDLNKFIRIITQEYLRGHTLVSFASELGIDASRQLVFQWKSGNQLPSLETLIKIINSPKATPYAKAWAKRCYSYILKSKGLVIDTNQYNPVKE